MTGPASTVIPESFGIEVYYPDTEYEEAEYLDGSGYLYAKFQWHWYLPATGVFKIKGSSPIAPIVKRCKRKVVPIVTSRNGIQWDGRVMNVEIDWDGQGEEIITVYCINNVYWLMTVLGWVNPQLPPEVQLGLTGKQDIMFGATDWVYKWFFARNAIRLDIPVYMKLPLRWDEVELPTLGDLLDLDALLEYVNGIDFIVLSSRFTKLFDLYKQTVETGEIGITCDLVRPTATDPGPMVFNTDSLATLQSILDITSDNFLDIRKFTELGSLVDTQMHEPGYVFHTHKKRDRKWQVWDKRSGVIKSYKRKITHATGSRVIVGGQAPNIMNQLVEFAANLAIQAIAGALTTLLGLPGVGAIAVGNMFDNIFFAFQQFVDTELANDLGRHGFKEDYADNTSAWNLDSFSIGIAKLKAIGGDDSFTLVLQTGAGTALEFGADIEVVDGVEVDVSHRRYRHGDIMNFYDDGNYVENYVSMVEIEDKRDGRMTEAVTFGDTRKLKDVWGQIFDRLGDAAAITRAFSVTG